LSSSDKKKNLYAKNKGSILNLEEFDGPVEFIGNKVLNNHVFIPSAIFSNLPLILASTLSNEQK
jgi:hypothetical protein